jgi:hypothetical protein
LIQSNFDNNPELTQSRKAFFTAIDLETVAGSNQFTFHYSTASLDWFLQISYTVYATVLFRAAATRFTGLKRPNDCKQLSVIGKLAFLSRQEIKKPGKITRLVGFCFDFLIAASGFYEFVGRLNHYNSIL